MNLRQHIKNEELQRLKLAWRSLTPLQKKLLRFQIGLYAIPRRLHQAFERRLTLRRARTAYWYPAHWVF